MNKTIKPWMIESMADNVTKGLTTVEKITNPTLAAKVSALLRQRASAQAAKDAGMDLIHMTGKVIRETDKAVLFLEIPIDGDQGQNTEESWWPKAMSRIVRRETSNLDGLYVPSKLVAEKTKCHPIFVAGRKVAE